MNMHLTISTDPSPTAARLREAWKARRAKEAAAARKVASANQNAPAVKREPIRTVQNRMPLWKVEDIQFDAHWWSWCRWKADQQARIGNYIAAKCKELGISVEAVKGSSHKKSIVRARDQIVYGLKTEVDPDISWPTLGRHFNRDHTSMYTCYWRGAAAAGDQEAIAKVEAWRQDNVRRHQERKAKGIR